VTDSIGVREDFALDRYLGRERGRIEAALRTALARVLPGLPEGLRGPVRHAVEAGGKRLRPILCVAAYTATRPGSPPDALYDLAVSSELIHTYSLMHDDLPCMDDAPLRRGRPTAHTRYGEIDTTLAGATLIPLAGLVAWTAGGELGLDDERRRAVLSRLAGPRARRAWWVGRHSISKGRDSRSRGLRSTDFIA
jgi:geranylgeranyl pyrophosphate synthase